MHDNLCTRKLYVCLSSLPDGTVRVTVPRLLDAEIDTRELAAAPAAQCDSRLVSRE